MRRICRTGKVLITVVLLRAQCGTRRENGRGEFNFEHTLNALGPLLTFLARFKKRVPAALVTLTMATAAESIPFAIRAYTDDVIMIREAARAVRPARVRFVHNTRSRNRCFPFAVGFTEGSARKLINGDNSRSAIRIEYRRRRGLLRNVTPLPAPIAHHFCQ